MTKEVDRPPWWPEGFRPVTCPECDSESVKPQYEVKNLCDDRSRPILQGYVRLRCTYCYHSWDRHEVIWVFTDLEGTWEREER